MSNVEQGMSNDEVRYFTVLMFIKMERRDSTLRHSTLNQLFIPYVFVDVEIILSGMIPGKIVLHAV